jgi:hypothetical protein
MSAYVVYPSHIQYNSNFPNNVRRIGKLSVFRPLFEKICETLNVSDDDKNSPSIQYLPTIPPATVASTEASSPSNKYLPTKAPTTTVKSTKQPDITYLPAKDIHVFPPNIGSLYLPPPSTTPDPLSNSYLPPPSGDINAIDIRFSSDTDKPINSYLPPKDLHAFPPNSGSLYLPPPTPVSPDPLKNSYLPPPSGGKFVDDTKDGTDADEPEYTYLPPKDLHAFPPNSGAVYLPPVPVSPDPLKNSYLPPPSGGKIVVDSDEEDELINTYLPPKDLHAFPPNVGSLYLPPTSASPDPLKNSYLPPPSGEKTDGDSDEKDEPNNTYLPPKDLHAFPPNSGSLYLPPPTPTSPDPLKNSYLPPPSGEKPADDSDEKDEPENTYLPPKDLLAFPPNVGSEYLPPAPPSPDPLKNSYLPPPSGQKDSTSDDDKGYFYPTPLQPLVTPGSIVNLEVETKILKEKSGHIEQIFLPTY